MDGWSALLGGGGGGEGWEGRWEVVRRGVKIAHQHAGVTSVTGCRHHRTDPQNLRKENGETEWIFISKASAGQTCAHKAPLQVGGLEGSSAVKVKAPADEPAQRFCSTSGSLWGQRLAGGLYQHARELHGTCSGSCCNHKSQLHFLTRWNHLPGTPLAK